MKHFSQFFFISELKIEMADSLLSLALCYSTKNTELLNLLENEQLPKLKAIFDIPMQPKMRNTNKILPKQSSAKSGSFSIEMTPKSSNSKFPLT